MATYKKNEGRLITIYRVEIDYYLDETVFNGQYLKNEDGQLVYFGLQNVDGDYLNKLSDTDLTNCITSSDDNYTIKLEKVDNTAAKIFVNKPKKKLTLDKRKAYIDFYYIDSLNNKRSIFTLSYYPQQICSLTECFSVQKLLKIGNPSFSFSQLYFVINYNDTGGVIDITELKKAGSFDITSKDLNKNILFAYSIKNADKSILPFINQSIYTYYSAYIIIAQNWYLYESGFTPIDFLSNGYDKLYEYSDMIHLYIFDYSKNRLTYTTINSGEDGILYFCAINESTNNVIPVFKMYTYYYDRTEMKSDETYTTYIVK